MKPPIVGNKVTRKDDGTKGIVTQVVDEEQKWGGPWTAQVEYEFNETKLKEWTTAQEWEATWR